MDSTHCAIRKVSSATGIISCIAGCSYTCDINYSYDTYTATAGRFSQPMDIDIDIWGNLFVADYGHHQVRMIDKVTNVIYTYAGYQLGQYSAQYYGYGYGYGYDGDGGAASTAFLYYPAGVALDMSGNLFIAEQYGRIRYVKQSTKIITTLFYGATYSVTWTPVGIAVNPSGTILYVTENNYNKIYRISASGGSLVGGSGGYKVIAGGGTVNISATTENQAAKALALGFLYGVELDVYNNVYFATYAGVVGVINNVTGNISVVMGTGFSGYHGDTGPATQISLYYPSRVALDALGNLFVCDQSNLRIRRLAIGQGSPSCPPGQVWYSSACSGCCSCPFGYYCPGDNYQHVCPANTYTSAAACISCPVGSTSNAGSSACSTIILAWPPRTEPSAAVAKYSGGISLAAMSLTSATLNSDYTVAFYGSTSGNVYAILTASGLLKWLFLATDAVYSAPGYTSVGGGYVAFGSNDNYVYLLTDEGNLVWRQKTLSAVSASPVFATDGLIFYVGSQDGTLYAFSVSTTVYSQVYDNYHSGHDLASWGGFSTYTPCADQCTANPRCLAFIWFANNGCWLKENVLSATLLSWPEQAYYRNQTVWAYNTMSPVVSTAAVGTVTVGTVSTKAVFVASLDYSVYALSASTGSKLWSTRTGGSVASPLLVSADGSSLYLRSNDLYVYALSTSTGSVVWKKNPVDAATNGSGAGVYSTFEGILDGTLAAADYTSGKVWGDWWIVTTGTGRMGLQYQDALFPVPYPQGLSYALWLQQAAYVTGSGSSTISRTYTTAGRNVPSSVVDTASVNIWLID